MVGYTDVFDIQDKKVRIDILEAAFIKDSLMECNNNPRVWLDEFRKWLSEHTGLTITLGEAYDITQQVSAKYDQFKKKRQDDLLWPIPSQA